MPFDCAPVIDEPKQAATTAVEALGTNIVARSAGAIRPRPILPWYMSRRGEGVDAAVAVLVRARKLISDERHWCKRAFAFTCIPVPVGSRYARRFCALGAIIRAGRDLGLRSEEHTSELQSLRHLVCRLLLE